MADDPKATGPAAPESEAPKPAATVILVRPAAEAPFEVFLVQRHARSQFMANAFVYPGGRLDEADCDERLALHCRGYVPSALAERLGVDDESLAVGLYIAAVRELFEEAGAFLVTESNGERVDFADSTERERYETYRAMLHEGEVDFAQIIEWEDLCLRVDELVYYAHWVTPEIEPRRYDTRFFLARAPDAQELVHDEHETTASAWLSPADALAAYDAGEFQLAPPTLHTLRDLATFESIDELFAFYAEAAIPTVLPRPKAVNGDFILLLPGDPDYPDPDVAPVRGATRVVMKEGRWWARGGAGDPEAEHEG